MVTRRNAMIGLGNLAVGSGVIASAGAFADSTRLAEADFRIITPPPDDIKLLPGRNDEAYVVTNEEGRVIEIVLDGRDVPGDGISKRAETRFEHIVLIEKEPPGPPFDDIRFEFTVEDHSLGSADPTPEEIEDVLSIIASDAEIPGTGETNYLQETDDADASSDLLEPNQQVPFGIAIDLKEMMDLPDPDDYTITLQIRAEPIPDPPGGGRNS